MCVSLKEIYIFLNNFKLQLCEWKISPKLAFIVYNIITFYIPIHCQPHSRCFKDLRAQILMCIRIYISVLCVLILIQLYSVKVFTFFGMNEKMQGGIRRKVKNESVLNCKRRHCKTISVVSNAFFHLFLQYCCCTWCKCMKFNIKQQTKTRENPCNQIEFIRAVAEPNTPVSFSFNYRCRYRYKCIWS